MPTATRPCTSGTWCLDDDEEEEDEEAVPPALFLRPYRAFDGAFFFLSDCDALALAGEALSIVLLSAPFTFSILLLVMSVFPSDADGSAGGGLDDSRPF